MSPSTTRGIRRDAHGWRAYVKVSGLVLEDGTIGPVQREKRYPPDTSIKTMQDWRDETKVALRGLRGKPAQPGSL